MDLKQGCQEFMKWQDAQSFLNTPGYDIAQFCSVDKLADGSQPALDKILVEADYQLIYSWSKSLGMNSTEDFWKSGMSKDAETFGRQLIDCFNKSWYKDMFKFNPTLNRSLIFAYSGHGVSAEDKSPVPKVTHEITKSALDKTMTLKHGDWQIHHLGYLGFDFMVHFFLTAIQNENIQNKTLIVLSDCCFSGSWCDELRSCLATDSLNNDNLHGCNLIIQASTQNDQLAHGGLFTPVWTSLQDFSTRERWLTEYEEQKDLIKRTNPYADHKKVQSPALASTSSLSPDPVFCVEYVGNRCQEGVELGGNAVSFFNNDSDFFWFCVSDYYGDAWTGLYVKTATVLSKTAARQQCTNFSSHLVVDLKLKEYKNGGKTQFFALYRVNTAGGSASVCNPACHPVCTSCASLYEVHVHYNEKTSSGIGPETVPRIGFNKCNTKNEVIRPLQAVDNPGKDINFGDWNPLMDKWLAEAEAHIRKSDPAADIKDPKHWKSRNSLFANFKSDLSLNDALNELVAEER